MKLFTLALVATGLAAMAYRKKAAQGEPKPQAGASNDRLRRATDRPGGRSWGESAASPATKPQRSEADGKPASMPQATGKTNLGDLP